jgi:hypothetical protein
MGMIGKPEREIHIPVTEPVVVPLPVPDPASPAPRREEAPAEPLPAGH